VPKYCLPWKRLWGNLGANKRNVLFNGLTRKKENARKTETGGQNGGINIKKARRVFSKKKKFTTGGGQPKKGKGCH